MAAATMITNQLIHGDAAKTMATLPIATTALELVSPWYWGADKEPPAISYGDYLDSLDPAWIAAAEHLRPNGKLAIITPCMPIRKAHLEQFPRHLKNIAADIEQRVLQKTDLMRYDLYIWRKQTSERMFGSYPLPGNIYANNTIEFISIFVKPGPTPEFPNDVKAASCMSGAEQLDFTQQIWNVYPADTDRKRNGALHQSPFPEKIPARLIKMFTYPGELVLDFFAGTGTTCVAAKKLGRAYIGIDCNAEYLTLAEQRLEAVEWNSGYRLEDLLVGPAYYLTKAELVAHIEELRAEDKLAVKLPRYLLPFATKKLEPADLLRQLRAWRLVPGAAE
jgi:DNA modification methylase